MAADPSIVDLIGKIFADHSATTRTVTTNLFDEALWDRLTDLGLSRLTSPSTSRGSEATWFEAAALLSAAGFYGIPGPFAENDLLANWLLEQVGANLDDDHVRTVIRLDREGFGYGLRWVGEVRQAAITVPTASAIAVYDAKIAGFHIASEPPYLPGAPSYSAQVEISSLGDPIGFVGPDVLDEVTYRGALARAAQSTGALERVLQLSVDHANTRVQFGRTLGKFQMIQQAVANIGLEVALARTATDTAVELAGSGADTRRTHAAIAIARSTVNSAIARVVRDTHQVHGAIGATDEHLLPRITGPALASRTDYGSPNFWDRTVADRFATGNGALWSQITALTAAAPGQDA
jgi:acyl-CoA dehydrogenase